MIRALFICILLAASFFLICACKDSDLAPGGTVLVLTAEPQQITVQGTATLTVTGTVDGAPLEDGVLIRFAVETGSGSVSPITTRTVNGSASSIFQATVIAEDVVVSATSGGSTDHVTIKVEGPPASRTITLTANPPSLPDGGGDTTIQALIRNESGNPVSGERVLFSTDEGTLQSEGSIIRTDNNGIATDILSTDESAEVTAELLEGTADEARLLIPVGSIDIVCSFTFSPENPSAGAAVTFEDTSTDTQNRIRTSFWDFGDGTTALGLTVLHTYTATGTFSVAHVVTDIAGNSFVCASERITVR